jgi:hypothetical protein
MSNRHAVHITTDEWNNDWCHWLCPDTDRPGLTRFGPHKRKYDARTMTGEFSWTWHGVRFRLTWHDWVKNGLTLRVAKRHWQTMQTLLVWKALGA